MNHGTIAALTALNDQQFPQIAKQARDLILAKFEVIPEAARTVDFEVVFLTCSRRGDIYMVHGHDRIEEQDASVRITQFATGADGELQSLAID